MCRKDKVKLQCVVYIVCCFLYFYVVHLPNIQDLVNIRYHTPLARTIHAIFYLIYLLNLQDLVNIRYHTTFI